MRNNNEIRKRMETYQTILLVLNWIFSIVLVIVGFTMTYLGSLAFVIIIGAIILGIIGHFLINVGLAIPFILLNNGDYLVAILKNNSFDDEEEEEEELAENQRIITNQTTLYQNPDINSKIVCELLKGEIITIIENKNINNIMWYNTEDKDGNTGWCKI